MSLDRFHLQAQFAASRDYVGYQAFTSDSNEPVNLYVLAAGVRADTPRFERLTQRLRRLRLIEHPSICKPTALGLNEDPPYVAFAQRRTGSTLREVLEEQPAWPTSNVVTIAQTLAEVLAEAHRVGLSHGDFTPERILVEKVGDRTQVVQVDFPWMEVPTEGGSPAELEGVPEEDIKAFGRILARLQDVSDTRIGQSGPLLENRSAEAIDRMIDSMESPAPEARPTAGVLSEQLQKLVKSAGALTLDASSAEQESHAESSPFRPFAVPSPSASMPRSQLGRFRLLKEIGQGSMGVVYCAEDLSDGTTVAIKVLRPELAESPDSLRRFRKEAQLLAAIQSAFVVQVLELNEDQGIHFLALEFVPGKSLDQLLNANRTLSEGDALSVMAQVAEGLEEAHERGIVHRDVKPQNILVLGSDEQEGSIRVKLADFGLGRYVLESESLRLTRTGAILGTPLYMAPEQSTGGTIVPSTDVYSMGATLFHLLAGRPPFQAETAMGLIAKHATEPPPSLRSLNQNISEGTCQVVEKALAKASAHRYASAGDLRRDLERLLRGEPTGISVHPHVPSASPEKMIIYDWVWDLQSSPAQLWPLVSNTERFNRAVGLPAVQFRSSYDSGFGVRRFGRFGKAGVSVVWEEHPFEWIEGRRMGVLREYSEGPWYWIVSIVDLEPRAGGGTRLTHRFRILPRGFFGRAVTMVNIGHRTRKAFDMVYRRIDASVVASSKPSIPIDPFEPAHALPDTSLTLLEQRLALLLKRCHHSEVIERLGEYLASAPAQGVARIRPIALAANLGVDQAAMIEVCLQGAQVGLLILLWDLICPVCRMSSDVRESLRTLGDHGHCEACNLDYRLDFAQSVEMIFRADLSIRDVELGVYCIGGPAHSPHVAAQTRLAPGERIELDVSLGEGLYRIRSPQLPFAHDFYINLQGVSSRFGWDLRAETKDDLPTRLRAGHQVIDLTNTHAREVIVRVERTVSRDDALTAARASSMTLFRSLFPGEVLAPGQLANVAMVALVVTAAKNGAALYQEGDDTAAFGLIHAHFRRIEDRVHREGGALVKTIAEGTVSAFSDPASAVRAALALHEDLAADPITSSLSVAVAAHWGASLVATVDGRLDYFGQTVNIALRLPTLAAGGEVVITPIIASEPEVAVLLSQRGLGLEPVSGADIGLKGDAFRVIGPNDERPNHDLASAVKTLQP